MWGRENLRVKGRVIAGNGRCQQKLKLVDGASDLGAWDWWERGPKVARFFLERANLAEFEDKVTVGVKKSDKYRGTKE